MTQVRAAELGATLPSEPGPAIAVAESLFTAITGTVRGKDDVVRQALVALLAGGHVLLEDLPGTGKTLLAKSLAVAIGGDFGRVQCTPDLLPSDITGTSVYRPGDGTWEFRPGPLFANIVLVDEINRTSPRTQAALLEPMEEHQVTVDATTHALPEPFFCVATQNPHSQVGTFPLPESQLDRFALVLSMGVPERDAEREILVGRGGLDAFGAIEPVVTPAQVAEAISLVHQVYCSPALIEYVLDLVAMTRIHPELTVGASPRASVGLVAAARAHAVVLGRDHVTPEDVQAIAGPALAHRVSTGGTVDTGAAAAAIDHIVRSVAVPRP